MKNYSRFYELTNIYFVGVMRRLFYRKIEIHGYEQGT